MGARNVLITHETRSFGLLREERKRGSARARRRSSRLGGRLGRRAARRVPRGSDGRAARSRTRSARRSPRAPPRRSRSAPGASTHARPRLTAQVESRVLEPVCEPEAVGRRRTGRLAVDIDVVDGSSRGSLDPLAEKFAKEGLTFDDVLLVPAESRVLPNDVSTATRLTRDDRAARSRSSRRRWTPSPRRAWPSRWRARAASASSTATSRSRSRPPRSTRSSARRRG